MARAHPGGRHLDLFSPSLAADQRALALPCGETGTRSRHGDGLLQSLRESSRRQVGGAPEGEHRRSRPLAPL
jgi:hypothetical protein